MNLDQRLTNAARQVAGEVTAPDVDLDVIRARARASRMRRASLAVAASLITVIAAGAAIIDTQGTATPDPAPSPPSPTTSAATPEPNPFPASMTPEEVVAQPGALLETVAVAPTDPATRMSIWSFSCTRPCPQHPPSSFSALALTTDGYETTTYVRPTFQLGVDLRVSSPRDDLFLVVDVSNGGEWLVNVDGTVRAVSRVSSEFAPDDPRLWFQCSGGWRENWCSLDPDTETAYQWPKPWDGSAARPGVGDRPWGANPKPRSTSGSGLLEAWWDTDSGRQLHTLAEVFVGDYVLGTPPGEMALWARPDAYTVDIYATSNGGADWQKSTRVADSNDLRGDPQLKRSPTGTLFLYTVYPQLAVWRADASGGRFRKVYEAPSPSETETSGAGLWTQGDVIYVNAYATAAISEDDGLTWTTVETWQ